MKIANIIRDNSPFYSSGMSASLPGKWMMRDMAVTVQTPNRQNRKKYFFRGFQSSM